MGRFAKDTGGQDFQQAPAGTHVAICIQIIDIGTHHGEYQGTPTVKNQVVIRWELPNEKMDDGQPFIVSAFYTNSLSEKSKLRPMLEAWRGRPFSEQELAGFDLQAILGKACMLNIISDNNRAKVSSVMALPKGMTVPPVHNKCKAFWIDEWDQAEFDDLPKGFQAMIMKSDEFKSRGGNVRPAVEENIPF